MRVVEKDRVISGMLQDELKRCLEILDGLQESLAVLPKGILSKRKKRYKEKVYSYYSLKYRDGEKVINRHISGDDVPELSKKLGQRKKLEKELSAYEKKVLYLTRILKAGKG